MHPGLRDSTSKNNTMGIVNLGELVATVDEESAASDKFRHEPSELMFVLLKPGVLRVSNNG